jgi:hypothetical protein
MMGWSVRKRKMIRTVASAVVGTAALGAVSLLGFDRMAAAAQDGETGGAALPTGEIVAGTCDALGESLFVLDGAGGGEDGSGERVGADAAAPLLVSVTTVDVGFEELIGSPHAVVVPTGGAEAGDAAACGEIGGYVDGDGLAIGLKEPGGEGLAGMAMLWDDRRTVEVELYVPEGAGDEEQA